MGCTSQLRLMAGLAGGAADFVAEHPEAAAFFARKLQQLLQHEASERENQEREENERNKRRGY